MSCRAEHKWEEAPPGSGKEDTAIIEFHSQREINHRRFHGLGVLKKVSLNAARRASVRSPIVEMSLVLSNDASVLCTHLIAPWLGTRQLFVVLYSVLVSALLVTPPPSTVALRRVFPHVHQSLVHAFSARLAIALATNSFP